jgi:probable H4MPT-linked C1 transfer pathway protein
MTWLALDIGGANLKASNGDDYATTRPFALWRALDKLAGELAALLAAAPPHRRIAVTMTGELCDCFETKAAGVEAILAAVESAADGTLVSVYLTDGRLVDLAAARDIPLSAAASNWLALAEFCCRFAGDGPAMLCDLGSTTADVIPLNAGKPCPQGRNDTERLAAGELVYTGVERTPLMAVVGRLPWRGRQCAVAAEVFATTADAYLLLGELPEESDNRDTADGRPKTRAAAHARVARMIGADVTMFSEEEVLVVAKAVRTTQLETLRAAASHGAARLNAMPATIIISGQGEFLLRDVATSLPWRPGVVSLSAALGPSASRCAPAYALAVLARERAEAAGE